MQPLASPKKRHLSETQLRIFFWLHIFGVLLSIYLVKDHYEAKKSVCDLGPVISCSIINRSEYAELFNVPVAVFGVTWFLVALGFVFQMYEQRDSPELVQWLIAHQVWTTAGMGFVFYLIAAEFILGAICPLCTIIHIILCIMFYQIWKFNQIHQTPITISLLLRMAFTMRKTVAIVAILHLIPLFYFNFMVSPEVPEERPSLDRFTECLKQNGFVMYGSELCPSCSKQKSLFGDAADKIPYVDCVKNESECDEKEIKGMPTWIQSDSNSKELKRRRGMMTVRELAEWSEVCSTKEDQSKKLSHH